MNPKPKQSYHYWTPEDVQYLKDNFQRLTCEELAEQIGVTLAALKKKRQSLGIVKSPEALRLIYSRPNAGQFKSKEDDIAVRMNKGKPMVYIRIGRLQYMRYNQYVWKMAGREIPAGYRLYHLNGDTQDCSLDNLALTPIRTRVVELNPETGKRAAHRKPSFSAKASEEYQESIRKAEAEKQAKKLQRQQAKEEKEKQRQAQALIRFNQQRKARIDKEKKRLAREQKLEPKPILRKVDHSQLVPLRIDAKTVIYHKPGRDPEQVREKYLNRMVSPPPTDFQ